MDCSPLILFVVSEFVQREMLSRLLREEEQKAEESVESVEGGKRAKGGKVRRPKSTDGQMGLL